MVPFFTCSLFIRVGLEKIKGVILLDNLFIETDLDNPCKMAVVKIKKARGFCERHASKRYNPFRECELRERTEET
jgi:hypothetical protein